MAPSISSTDEELAVPCVGKENSPSIQSKSGSNAKPTEPGRQSSPSKSHFTPFRIAAALMLLGAAVALAALGPFSKSSAESSDSEFDLFDPSTWDWIPRWLDDNPHGGDTPYDFSTWDTQTSCKGLDLHIIDNLDDEWQPYFKQAINDWDDGDPDVLTLHVRKPAFHDTECEPSRGVMKVCNGDYGETDWIGVNHIALQWNRITSSVAIMNDYHLGKMNDAAKQNTMCHELGHGFGLGHWDEDFYNKDLGNCMDYTKKHENNQSPDRSNFLFLEQMYGNVDGSSRYFNDVNGTAGLNCVSPTTTSEFSKIFKHRKLGGSKEADDVELADEHFPRDVALLVSEHMQKAKNLNARERSLRCHRYNDIRVESVADGIKVVSTFRLA